MNGTGTAWLLALSCTFVHLISTREEKRMSAERVSAVNY